MDHIHIQEQNIPPPKLTFVYGHKFIIIVQLGLTVPGESQLASGISQKCFQIISKHSNTRILGIIL